MAKINYSAAELDQHLDTAVYDGDAVVGMKLPALTVVSGEFRNRRDITAAGWYRIATVKRGITSPSLVHLCLSGLYNSQVPTTADLTIFIGRNTSSTVIATWKANNVKAAGRSVSKVRYCSNGSNLNSLPSYIDIYIPRAMTASSGQGYFYTVEGAGIDMDIELTPPTLVSADPAVTSEYTLANTTE